MGFSPDFYRWAYVFLGGGDLGFCHQLFDIRVSVTGFVLLNQSLTGLEVKSLIWDYGR